MLTRPEDVLDDDLSSGAVGSRSTSARGGDTGSGGSVSNLQTVLSDEPEEPWALVSLGGDAELEDTAIVNNLSGLDLDSINQESGVSSLSSTNGVGFDGQTILSSLGPEVDEDDDADDGLLFPGPNQDANSAAAENDGLSIPDTVPSNIRSIRSGTLARGTARHQTSRPDKKNSKQRETILVVSFAILFLGVTFLASTWRRSALRLEAELDALRNLKQTGGANSNTAIASGASPPLFADRNEEGTPFTVADNCYIKAEASVSLGSCGSELRGNLQNASYRISKGFERFTRKFEEAFWAFGDDDDDGDVDNNTTGTFFSSSSSFFSRPRAADAGASQTFSRFTTFWKSERNRWNKASKQFASELNAAANRTAENVHHTLNQANEAIEQGMRSLIDHARDAIEEGTSVVREVNVGEGEYVYSSKRGLGAKSMEGFHKYLNDIISNITSVNLIAGEIPDFGGSQ